MNPFHYQRPAELGAALSALSILAGNGGKVLAGGTNLIDLMKEGVVQPAALLDIRRLPFREITRTPDGGLHLGALATNSDTANHPLVREQFSVLRAAILAGASPQIRHMATNGGNLLQRTRCYYYYDTAVPCNKRKPGSGCPAVQGLARQHAILGASPHCIATHPSDMCVALAALEASVHVVSQARGERVISFADFHRLPGDDPTRDNILEADELITHLSLPSAARFQGHASYLKLRERASYAFAVVSVAAMLELDADGTVRDARLVLGSVAHKPWRDEAAEHALVGRRAESASFEAAADAVLHDARPWGGPALPESTAGNAYKIPLARRAIVRALEMATAGELTNTGEDAFRQMDSELEAAA